MNSPPVAFTTNGKAFATNKQPNLEPARYDDYAAYLATVLDGLRQKTGIALDYLSPVNEPQWDWSDGSQEGSPFRNEQVAGIAKALSRQLVAHKLPTQIIVPEAGKLDYLYTTADKPERGNQLAAFWADSTAVTYLGATPRVARIAAGHGYFTTSPYALAVGVRQKLAAKVQALPKLDFWQSEYCILNDNAGEINGNGRDLGMTPALYVARAIHADLAVANATSWQWWLAVSPHDYKDGLVYTDKNKTDGRYYPSKLLWALGNYSRYLRPGAVRFSTSLDAPAAGALLVSAYQDAKDKNLITIVVNDADAPADLRLELVKRRLGAGRTYVTSANADLQPGPAVAAGQVLHVAARSITTLVSELR
ncbi:glycoside hydrolase [Hymenobacter mellowenesis]